MLLQLKINKANFVAKTIVFMVILLCTIVGVSMAWANVIVRFDMMFAVKFLFLFSVTLGITLTHTLILLLTHALNILVFPLFILFYSLQKLFCNIIFLNQLHQFRFEDNTIFVCAVARACCGLHLCSIYLQHS